MPTIPWSLHSCHRLQRLQFFPSVLNWILNATDKTQHLLSGTYRKGHLFVAASARDCFIATPSSVQLCHLIKARDLVLCWFCRPPSLSIRQDGTQNALSGETMMVRTNTNRQTDRHTQTQTQTDRQTDTQTHTDIHRHTQTHTDTRRNTQTHTDRLTGRQTDVFPVLHSRNFVSINAYTFEDIP